MITNPYHVAVEQFFVDGWSINDVHDYQHMLNRNYIFGLEQKMIKVLTDTCACFI